MTEPRSWCSGSLEDFFTPVNFTPRSRATSSTLHSRLLIALWVIVVTPTRLPFFSSSTIACADVNVLPVPGGP